VGRLVVYVPVDAQIKDRPGDTLSLVHDVVGWRRLSAEVHRNTLHKVAFLQKFIEEN